MRVALIGAHGSGKSTIGSILQSNDWTHWSLGDLRRRLRSSQDCAMMPPAVVRVLHHMRPGQPLEPAALRMLLDHCPDPIALDGVPDSAAHVPLFGPDWAFISVRIDESIRQQRLHARSLSSDRLWIDGLRSERDARLEETQLALLGRRFYILTNNGSQEDLRINLNHVLLQISHDLRSN